MKTVAILLLLGVAFGAVISLPTTTPPLPAYCDGKESELADNTQLLCDPFVSMVFRGKPNNPQNVGATLQDGEERTDVFDIDQVFKPAYWNMMTDPQVTVTYVKSANCPSYPYDSAHANIIYGMLEDGGVKVLDCSSIKVYDCIKNQPKFNSHQCESEFPSEGDGFFPFK